MTFGRVNNRESWSLIWLNTLPDITVDLKTIVGYIDEEMDKVKISSRHTEMRDSDKFVRNPLFIGRTEESEPHYLPINNTRTESTPGLWASGASGRLQHNSCVEPPDYFLPGESSIPDGENSMRMFKVAKIFQCAFGTKKFVGKRGKYGEEGSITSLLEAFNRAQFQCPVTETEFVTFLCQAMYGEPQSIMTDYARKHKRGTMSIQNIYAALTELYFMDLRPNSAIQRLRELTDTNHPYYSLAEAQTDVGRLCTLASYSARSPHRQEALMAEHFAQTIMRLVPKEYKPIATTMVQTMATSMNRDLNPEDIVSCLESIRPQVDEIFRKIQNKNSSSNARVRRLENKTSWDKQNESNMRELLWDEQRPYEDNGAEAMVQRNFVRQDTGRRPPTDRARDSPAPPNNGTGKVETKTMEVCKLCGNPKHSHRDCPFFPEGKNLVANSECKICKSGLFHQMKFCPKNQAESKN